MKKNNNDQYLASSQNKRKPHHKFTSDELFYNMLCRISIQFLGLTSDKFWLKFYNSAEKK
ncbi:hypothetical protein KS2013_1062 [Kangiella sediminilitoris]|uniref:Uncharacterized protein n=1 Tax=Kangiella sediminilitoris TaxID=1144748 RepID=A0A1B3BAE7_9GAMM|nr:hypothetical protein KS2013_1062 [Kangiella sediminilitoris]